MSEMNFAELIKPITYELDRNVQYNTHDLKQMTAYDMKHITNCRDMLELILRADCYLFHVKDYIGKDVRNVAEIEKYAKFISTLIKHIRFYDGFASYSDKTVLQQFSDFSKLIPFHAGEYVYTNMRTSKNCIATNDSSLVHILTEINLWQSYYVTIYNMIVAMGNEANEYCTIDELNCKCHKWLKHAKINDCNVCLPGYPCDFFPKGTPNNTETKVTEAKSDTENYKKLITDDYTDLFEKATARARIKKAKDGCIIVQINDDTLTLRTDFSGDLPESTEFANSDGTDIVHLSDFALDEVKIIPISRSNYSFAYAGFWYNDVLYEIPSYKYQNMLECIMRHEDYMKNLSKDLADLIDLVNRTRQDIANLPEVEYCQNATFTKEGPVTKILHGPNIMHINIMFSIKDELKFQELVGRCDGKTYRFVKVGKRTYRTEELNEYETVEIMMRQRVEDVKDTQ